MKPKSLPQGKARSRSIIRSASPGLIDYLNLKYKNSIPVSAITTAHKLYGRTKPLTKDDPFFRKFGLYKNNVET
jgi:hypothetical protein